MIIQFFFAMLGTIAFSILFQAPRREIIFCGFTGGLGWIVYYTLINTGMNHIFSCTVATVILTILARCFASLRRNPATVYLVAGILPLVPGAGIYYTAYYLVNSDKTLFLEKGLETFEFAAAIGFGILIGFSIPQKLFNRTFSRQHKSGGSQ